MAALITQLSKSYISGITTHAFNADASAIAVCPNNTELHIYSKKGGEWTLAHKLTEHDMLISGVDWHASSNMIVTCSHDRNAFVWGETKNADGTTGWKPALVILRIDRGALDVKWSPNGRKFAAASGAKCVSVCCFEESENWWISKSIKKHKSTVTCLAWHPNSQFLATGSTDFKCRVFSAIIVNADTGMPDAPGSEKPCCNGKFEPFGEAYCEFPSSGNAGISWVTAVAWSPSGTSLAFASQDSSIGIATFAADGAAAPVEQYIKFGQLPLASLVFCSDIGLIGAGQDYSPMAFVNDSGGQWSLAGPLEERPAKGAKAATSSGGGGGVASRMAMFEKTGGAASSSSSLGSGGGIGGRPDKYDSSWKAHNGAVTALSVHGAVVHSTGLDGRLITWDLAKTPISAAALGIA